MPSCAATPALCALERLGENANGKKPLYFKRLSMCTDKRLKTDCTA